MPIVAAEGLTKYYGRHLAVDDVSFELPRGEVLGLIGPNGSGKSTILRMLIGFLRPSAGRVLVAGIDVSLDGPAARAHIGYVPEDIPLYETMRVDEFLRTMAALKGLSGNGVVAAVGRVIDRLELGQVRRSLIARLSRGYRQRTAIAQALLADPPLIIFDEPGNGLDPRQIIECRELIRELRGEHAVLVTSHILSEIEKLADRAAILLDGRLLTIDEVRAEEGAVLDLEARFLELTQPAA